MAEIILFDFCQFTVNKDVKCSKLLEDKIKSLGFQINSDCPIKIEKHGLNAKTFKLLTKALLDQFELLSLPLAHLNTEDSNDLKTDGTAFLTSLPNKCKTLVSTKTANVLREIVSVKESTDETVGFETVNKGLYSQAITKNEDSLFVSKSDAATDKTKLIQDKAEIASAIPFISNSYGASQQNTKLQSLDEVNKNEYETSKQKLKRRHLITEFNDHSQETSVDEEYCQTEFNIKINVTSKEKLESEHKNEINKFDLTEDTSLYTSYSCNLQCAGKEEKHIQIGKSSKNANKTVDKKNFDSLVETCAVKKRKHYIKAQHSDSDGSDMENLEYCILKSKNDFDALKFYFKDDKLYEYIMKAKLNGNGYEIEFNEKDVLANEKFETLKNFQTFSLDEFSVDQALKWSKLINENYKKIKVMHDKTKFLIMGPKNDVLSARSSILSFKGNKDEEMIRPKPSAETHENFTEFMDNNGQGYSLSVVSRHIRVSSGRTIYIGVSNLQITVEKADITKLDVDIIVNAANSHLSHGGGVAAVIAEAAGHKLQRECEDFIKKHNALGVTDVFVSSGGNLLARYVIHAVGPKWDNYPDSDKWKCLRDLRQTVLRCLLQASRLGGEIALPSISAAIFKVPLDSCVKCYMEAVKNFDFLRQRLNCSSLRRITFVDINDHLVNSLREEFDNEWKLEPDEIQITEDIDLATRHFYKQKEDKEISVSHYVGTEPKELEYPLSRSELNVYTRKELRYPKLASSILNEKPTKECIREYQCKKLKIYISDKPAISYKKDECIIVIGKPFQAISGLPDCSISKVGSAYGNFSVKDIRMFKSSAKGRESRDIHILECDIKNKDNLKQAFSCLTNWILSERKYTNIAMTSLLLYPESNHSEEFKLVCTFADLLHKCIKQLSEDKLIKYIRIATSSDACPNITKVFDSREDLTCIVRDDTRPKNFSVNKNIPSSKMLEDIYKHDELNDRRKSETERLERKVHYARQPSFKSKEDLQEGTSVDDEKVCPICFTTNSTFPLDCCNMIICNVCSDKVQRCPFCRKAFGIIKGNQPDGEMLVKYLKHHQAAGHEHLGVWEIEYNFKAGVQKGNHPHPGKPYYSTVRKAFLPDTSEAYNVLLLLRLAFMRRLTFTIGPSLTQNVDDKITWNDIHHKTSLCGRSFGYPDPDYLQRVTEELKDRYVTLESLSEKEKKELEKFKRNLKCIK